MSKMASHEVEHDLETGHVECCQLCAARDLELIVDLGHQPPCDSLLTPAQLNQPETAYPLRFLRCQNCGHAQIDYVVAREIVFHPAYPYRSGITATLVYNLQRTARTIVESYGLKEGELAIDIGSNDGTLLKGFRLCGLKTLGVEATNVAEIAIADGIETIQSFFGASLAADIVATRGQASAITATNMFAHVSNLGDLLRGVTFLLRDGGVFVTESHYLPDLLETVQYDSIYHEHLKYYSLRTLVRLFEYYDFSVVDAERIPNYGGSIRVYAVKQREAAPSERLTSLLADEDRIGLHTPEPFSQFKARTEKSKTDLVRFLVDLKSRNIPAPAIGCPGRASTLINYCKLDSGLLPYIAEQSSSLKLGLFLPGTHIPIVDERRLFEEQPEYALMLSWHYADAIVESLRRRGLKSKIIIPLPEISIV
jgi:hypothetical protein